MNKQSYDYAGAAKLRDFTLKMNFYNQLNNTAKHIYALGMPDMEREITGLCQLTTANYRKLAEYAHVSVPSIKKALIMLNGKLCDIDIGQSVKKEGIATRFKRYTIKELQDGKPYQKLKNERPLPALQLHEKMQDRSFVYNGKTIKPMWSIGVTGRLSSSRPNVQGDSKGQRFEFLQKGLEKDEVLFYLDYCCAEPTVLQYEMDYQFKADPYEALAKTLGISRDEAKNKINGLHYNNVSPVKIVQSWSSEAQNVFMSYADALENLRESFWQGSKPEGKGRRRIETLCGSEIVAMRGNSPHRGQLLCWYAQGTIADILNQASIEIIEQEKSKGWQFLFPLHDGAYIIGKPEHEEELKAIFINIPKKHSLPLSVDCKIFRTKSQNYNAIQEFKQQNSSFTI